MQLGLTCQAGAGSPSALHSDGVCSKQPQTGWVLPWWLGPQVLLAPYCNAQTQAG